MLCGITSISHFCGTTHSMKLVLHGPWDRSLRKWKFSFKGYLVLTLDAMYLITSGAAKLVQVLRQRYGC